MTSIWWVRRDLRLTDNLALHSALQTDSVIPIFILDPAFATQSLRRKSFFIRRFAYSRSRITKTKFLSRDSQRQTNQRASRIVRGNQI
ncbi:MAG: deoxyribodipyrimidine photo-lyase [Anaerolineales bacterium]|nr:deoxyribodipyrimidine photo-lyase [Anaerolineales bacterium]